MADNNSSLLTEVQSVKSGSTQLDDVENNSKAVNSLELGSSNGVEMDNIKDEKTLTSDVPMVDASPTKKNSYFFDASSNGGSEDPNPSETSKPNGSLDETNDSLRLTDKPCPSDGVELCDGDKNIIETSGDDTWGSPSRSYDQGNFDLKCSKEGNMSIDVSEISFDADEKPLLSDSKPQQSFAEPAQLDDSITDSKIMNDNCLALSSSNEVKLSKEDEKSITSYVPMNHDTESPVTKSDDANRSSPFMDNNHGESVSENNEVSEAANMSVDASEISFDTDEKPKPVDQPSDLNEIQSSISKSTQHDDSGIDSKIENNFEPSSDETNLNNIKEDKSSDVPMDCDAASSIEKTESDEWGAVPTASAYKEESEFKASVDDTWGSSGGDLDAGSLGESAASRVTKNEDSEWTSSTGGNENKQQSKAEAPSDDDWGIFSVESAKKEIEAKSSLDDDWGAPPAPAVTKNEVKTTPPADDGWGLSSVSTESKSEVKAKSSSDDDWGSSGADQASSEPKAQASTSDAWGSSGGGSDWGSSSFGGDTNKDESKQSSGGDWGSSSWGDDGGSSAKSSGGSGWGSSSGGRAGGSGGKSCFKCGQEGHMSRECPSGGGSSRGGKGCFKCGEEGHMSRECPKGGASSRGGGKGCFKCGQEGHMSRECPSGGGSSRGGGKGCFKCGQEGHMSRECPSGGGSSRGGGSGGRSGGFTKSEGSSWGGSSWGDEAKDDSKSKSSSDDTWGGSSWGNETKTESKSKGSSGDTWGGSGGDQGSTSSWGESAVSPAKKSCNDWGSSSGSKETKNDAKVASGDWGGGIWETETNSGGASGGGGSWGDSGSSPARGGSNEWGSSSGTSDRGKSGGSGGRACFKCGEEGHMSRECPKGGGGGSGSRGKGCHKCGKEGHMAKDCSEPSLDADGKPRPPVYKPPELSENDESLFDTVAAGDNFDAYFAMPCSVSGEDVPKNPERYETFEEAFTSETILKGLKQSKIMRPTPIQRYGMRIVMAGRDLMACAQTGSGKTLAFVLPILQDLFNDKELRSGYGEMPAKPKALIISPTRELAVQIYKEAYKYSRGSIVKVQIVYGGTSVAHQRAKLSEGAHILVGTAGRLLDFLDKNYYDFSELKYLILDEADRMIDQGFIPDVRKMIIHRTMPPKEKRQTLMFSATFANTVQKVAGEFLVPNYLFLTVGILGAANSDVSQTLLKVEKFSKRPKLLEILKESDNNDRTMIFVESKRTADFLASFLSQSDYKATSIHGDRYQRQREEALEDLKSGKFPILVATSVASRGLDIKDVRHVINYDLPSHIDDYIHRIGRTGRVGNKGKATSFYDPEADKALAAKIVEVIKSAKQPVPDWLVEEAAGGTGKGYGASFGGVDYRGGVSNLPDQCHICSYDMLNKCSKFSNLIFFYFCHQQESELTDYQDLDTPKESIDLEW